MIHPRAAVALVAAAALWGCGEDEEAAPAEPFFAASFASTFAEVRDCRGSVEHNLVHIRVHADPGAAAGYRDGVYPLPAGTVIVKTEFADDQCAEVDAYTAMRKPADGGEWEWQRLAPDRTVLESGRVEACIRCHNGCTHGRDMTCTDP